MLRREQGPGAASGDVDDAALLAGVARGDREAFRLLVRRLTPRGLAVAARMTGSRSEGEDVLQDAFLRLWHGAGGFDAGRGGAVRTWFHRIVVNLSIDQCRRRRPHDSLEAAADVADPAADAAAGAESADRARRVARALAALPETQRAAVVLCYYEEMRNADAAVVLGVSVHALEGLLARGRRALRKHLGDMNGEGQ